MTSTGVKKWFNGRLISPKISYDGKKRKEYIQVSDHWKLHDLRKKVNKNVTESADETLTSLQVGLRVMITQMRRVKWCFHFTRNNPNHTKRFYYRLKAIVGQDEEWDKISPDIRQAWEDAANRFDMQYGLVRAWTMTPWVLKPIKPNAPKPEQTLDNVLKKYQDDINEKQKEISKWGDVDKLIKDKSVDNQDFIHEVNLRKEIANAEITILQEVNKKLQNIKDIWNSEQNRIEEETKNNE